MLTPGRWGTTVTPSWRSGRDVWGAGSEDGSVSAVSEWGGRFREGDAVRKPLGSLGGLPHWDAAQSFRTERRPPKGPGLAAWQAHQSPRLHPVRCLGSVCTSPGVESAFPPQAGFPLWTALETVCPDTGFECVYDSFH